MKARCNNSNASHYEYYGGRGIKVCEEWNGSFSFPKFLEDMGECPDKMELDRIDTNGNYCKENCRWVTREVNINNTRKNKFITYKDETLTIAQWAKRIGADQSALYHRLFISKWDIKRALTESFIPFKYNEIEIDGESKTLAEWSREYKIKRSTVNARLKRGWNIKDALTISSTGNQRKILTLKGGDTIEETKTSTKASEKT
jgi:hypothetical protein